MNPVLIKTLYAVAILAVGWLGGWLPIALGNRLSGRGAMGLGNAFAAGVFLGTGLIHLLSEAGERWSELGWSFPMAPALAALGFMALLLVEHVLLPQSVHEVVHAHSGEHLAAEAEKSVSAGPMPYALLVALSGHSVIAGVALGAQSTIGGATFILVAILAHKWSAAFALGISLVRNAVARRRAYGQLALFALSTPLGVVAGSTLSGPLSSSVGRSFDAAFLSIAAGAFIYIAAVDILQDEFLHTGGRLAKWLAAALAVALTAAVSAVI